MDIIRFKECNVVFAKDQSDYLPLSAHRAENGTVTSCWKLSFWEKVTILITGKIFLRVLTFNKPLQPMLISVAKPEL